MVLPTPFASAAAMSRALAARMVASSASSASAIACSKAFLDAEDNVAMACDASRHCMARVLMSVMRPPCGLFDAYASQQHQIVAMHDVLAIGIAEYGLDIARVAARDAAHIHGGILADAARDAPVAAIAAQDELDHVASPEITLGGSHASRQQRRAFLHHCVGRACIDHDGARLHRHI